ncbi:phosphoinositide 3-kinase regulatory subunit 4 [Eremomyces bilateralis CBS 781.70]|uniref:non-specific serine/threonine protein kinase n=1 Tax=Eremomyces bilateralis CBS 781.70 TaxID=1392243 RepID=A0A6G1GHM6_9PEZI|nr:phosphoinositide 3-kinase regulatory subunit 4 [Eremomyces bilateralis CBS 781.70]KAF1817401.1 phosphoinositide 3-kinase regulatory subunit 4 [Eremomyces bilateralis CBS 781.70]
MGQGYSLTTLSAGSAGIDVPELADLTYDKSLGNARFMKCIRARHRDGLAVAKVIMKPFADMKLDEYVRILHKERQILADIPNAIGYHRIVETGTNGFLVRQYIHSSLYDRLSTRPFLEDIEKKWVAFQLLCAVRDCHAQNLFHGDIKTENILVTSWNWLYLSDFSSSFKPAYLPEDNPADFSFYFDTSGRRTCYLAPERFLSADSPPENRGGVNWSMDIFSTGCVIAELFLETPIFQLHHLFKYKKGEYDPILAHVNRIADKDIRELVTHMIQLDPEARYSAEEYLNFWRSRAFPDYFYNFLHQYMNLITDPANGRAPVTTGPENLGESDERIDRVYKEFDSISYALGYELPSAQSGQSSSTYKSNLPGLQFPLHLDIPNNKHVARASIKRAADDGTLIFLTLVVASVRSTARATSRIRACELMMAFAERVTDEAKLDRILPYAMVLLNDASDLVKAAALRAVSQITALVNSVSPINAYVFPEYVLPRLKPFVTGQPSNPSPFIRATYASCVATLASTASKFLDMMQALRADGSLPAGDPEAEANTISQSVYQMLYDVAQEDLTAQFEAQTKAILTDRDSAVRRSFLGSIATLCVFFGQAKAADVVLSHLNTYVNDPDWMLKCAFFETVVGVGIYVGSASLEEFVLPLMIQALTDPEEFVVERVLRSLSSLAQVGLFQRARTWKLVSLVARFTMHPNIWIREASAQFIEAASSHLAVSDCHSIIIPILSPYVRVAPSETTELKILDSLKKPLPRLVLDMGMTWALKAEKGIFWKSAKDRKTGSFGYVDEVITRLARKDIESKALNKVAKNEEDEQWVSRLRGGGMSPEDEFKFLCLRQYIWRVAHRKPKHVETAFFQPSGMVALKDHNASMQTVLFDPAPGLIAQASEQPPKENRIHSLADALLDASTTGDDALARRKRSHINSAMANLARVDTGESKPGINTSHSSTMGNEGAEPGLTPPRGVATGKARAGAPNTDSGADNSYPSSVSSTRLDEAPGMKRRGSAMSLIHSKEGGSKAPAEIGTTSTNAFGRVDSISRTETNKASTFSPLNAARQQHREQPNEVRFKAAHSYGGNDPTVLKLLDSLYLEHYPLDRTEFGPPVTPLRQQTIKRSRLQPQITPWRPEGILIALLSEHTGAINKIAIAPDHLFFLTASDDGFVKVWETSRLERNVTHRSKHTFRLNPGVRVTSLTFIENTYCFACAGSDGSVTVVKLEILDQTTARLGKLRTMREFSLDDDQYAIWSEHFKQDNQSVLIMATNKSRVIALDLRTMGILYELHNPLRHGTITSFCLDRRHHWILLGSSHGVLDLWDLRFRLRVKAWAFQGGSPIHRITQVNVRGAKKNRILIAGGTGQGEVTSWDIEKPQCKEIFRISSAKENSKGYQLVDIDDDKSGGMLGRFATSVDSRNTTIGDHGVRALAVGAHVNDDGEARQYFAISAGPDWKVRFWDPARPEYSSIVSGHEVDAMKPGYSASQMPNELTIITERSPVSQPREVSASPSPGSSKSSKAGSSKDDGSRRTSGKLPRSSMISLQQQQLLRSHLDTITDVVLVESPFGMVVSGDRSGAVYVFA